MDEPIEKLTTKNQVALAVCELLRCETMKESEEAVLLGILQGSEVRLVGGDAFAIVRLADHSLFRVDVAPLSPGDASWINVMGGWRNQEPVPRTKKRDVSIQEKEGDFEFTIEKNSRTYDTEEIGIGYPVDLFKDTREFAMPPRRAKTWLKDTNLEGNGGRVARGQAYVFRRIGVTFLEPLDHESEKAFIDKATVCLWDKNESFQKIGFKEHELGISELGEEIFVTVPDPIRVDETQEFGVVLRSPALARHYPVRVTLYGEHGWLTYKGEWKKGVFKPEIRLGEFGVDDGLATDVPTGT